MELVLKEGAVGEVYNVGGQEKENMEVVRRILDLTGGSPDLVRHVEDRPGHDRRYAIDASKIRRDLGWEPRHTFETGLLDTVRWYLEHQDWCEQIQAGRYERQRLGLG